MTLDPRSDIRLPSMWGGMSDQPEHQRLFNQIRLGKNAVFRISEGAAKRGGSKFLANIEAGTLTGSNYRLHGYDRDGSERYVIIHGLDSSDDYEILVYQADGTSATVNIDAAAQAYLDLNNADSSQIRFTTSGDTTFIVNTTVGAGSFTDELTDYTVTEEHRDYGTMTSILPDPDEYHRTLNDFGSSPTVPAGYWQYVVAAGDNGFANFLSQDMTTNWRGVFSNWDNAGFNPMGMVVRCQRQAIAQTGVSFNHTTFRLTKAGAFTNYVYDAKDEVHITAGTGFTAGFYKIASRVDNDTIQLVNTPSPVGYDVNDAEIASLPGATVADVEIAGITQSVEVLENFSINAGGTAADTMDDIAERLEADMQSAGGEWVNALINWQPTGASATRGKLQLVSPWRGTGTSVVGIYDPRTAGHTSLATGSNKPFHFPSGTATAGSGSPATSTLDVELRWDQVAPPGGDTSSIDPDTMPVQMVRTSSGVFTVSQINWNDRLSGTDDTNPIPSIFDQSLPIRDVVVFRNRLWLLGGEYVVASRDGDLFNFYAETAGTVADTDPIDVQIADDQVCIGDYFVPMDKALVVFTQSGNQFEVSAPEAMTPKTVAITATTDVRTLGVRPRAMGSAIYFPSSGIQPKLHEYLYRSEFASSLSDNATAHAGRLLPSNIREMAAVPNEGTIVVLPENNRDRLYTFTTSWRGGQLEQRAWGLWEFDAGYDVQGIVALGDEVFMLVKSAANGWFLESVRIERSWNAVCPKTCTTTTSTTTTTTTPAPGPNVPPVANNDSASCVRGQSVAINVLANDTDGDGTIDPTTVAIASAASSGSTSINPTTGVITYTHNGTAGSSDSFTYTVDDDDGDTSNAATVTVTITDVTTTTTTTPFIPTTAQNNCEALCNGVYARAGAIGCVAGVDFPATNGAGSKLAGCCFSGPSDDGFSTPNGAATPPGGLGDVYACYEDGSSA